MLSTNELFKQAVLAHKGGATMKAYALYSKVILAEATHAHANHNLGVLLVSEGKVQQALNCFKTAIESNPNVGQFWASYIDALLRMGQHQRLRSDLYKQELKVLTAQFLTILKSDVHNLFLTTPHLLSARH